MLWKTSVIRMTQGVKRYESCTTAESVTVEHFTVLLPRCDRPAETLRYACHATDWVDHEGVSNQFKNVAIAGAVAIGIGTGQIEAHYPSVGEDELELATAIGQRGNQRPGID